MGFLAGASFLFHQYGWGGRIRTFGMTESESVALPLGDTPMFVRFSLFLVGIDGFEPSE